MVVVVVALLLWVNGVMAGKESTAHENEQLRSFSMVVGCGRIVNRLRTPPSCVSCKGGGVAIVLAAVSMVQRDEEG
jgi:hypothetical protein